MLDLKVLRENPEAARAAAIKTRLPERVAAVDKVLAIDAELREMTPRLDAMRSEQKNAGKQMAKLAAAERELVLEQQKLLKVQIGELEEREKLLRSELDEQMLLIPNLP